MWVRVELQVPVRRQREETNMSTMTRIFLVLLLVASAVSLLHAQGGAYGTILGTVTDNSGAVVARANVDVTNLNTNVTKRTVTTSSGDFTLPYLERGNYRVSVQSQGFQKSVGTRQSEMLI